MASARHAPTRRAPTSETPPIDERIAWKLLHSIRPGAVEPVQVHDSSPAVWLQVYPSGAWTASSPVTDDARQLLDLYLPLQRQADIVIAQAGQSLDGRIATVSGHSHYVTGLADIRRLHRLRALVDAVVVGAATVDADNPRLTVREVDGDNPVRVVIDPNDRVDRSRHVFRDRAAPTIVVRRASGGLPSDAADDTAGAAARRPPAATVIELPADSSGEISPRDVVAALRALGHRRLLIEGGGFTVSRFIDAGAVDRLHVAVAPLLIGSGHPAFTLTPIATLEQAIRPACRTFRLGEDVLFDLDLRSGTPARRPPGM